MEDLPVSIRDSGLPTVRRPTGGGAVLHRPGEVAYSIAAGIGRIVPLRDLPVRLHAELKEALGPLVPGGFHRFALCPASKKEPATLCFSEPVCGDLLYEGRKVAGSALRVWRDGFLLQGSLQGFPVPWAPLIQALIQAADAVLSERCAEARSCAEGEI